MVRTAVVSFPKPNVRTPGRAAATLTGQVGMSHHFVIQIDHGRYDFGQWTKASGLGVSWTPHRYRAGNTTAEVIQPAVPAYTTISLSRAACADSAVVQKWLVTVVRSRQLLSGAVSLIDFTGLPVISWKLKEFFPIGWRIGEFDSGGSRPVLETLELAHGGFLDDEVRKPW
ncbi:phage tail protein [Amycolatopsis sp. OK19-0408]|uniref:Phage tail protein n=1 Tax=Amycolatopsis iheyensis TaxID=2945988 RepID=A0A9X2SMN9_9PSEU|nr:phage tail protein [Amycolatopsis iheyensis]MCR6487824.1 phage tail protein [Amycolatopsis iheyensis]